MTQPYRLHVLLEEEARGKWSAHVLDFDIVASADTEEGVLALVPGLITTWIDMVRERGPDTPVIRPASPEEWQRFLHAPPGRQPLKLPKGIQLPGIEWEFRECDLGRYRKAA